MPPGGGYRAGSIYADLSFRLDDTGAAKFEKRMRTARSEAAKPVTAKLEADYDSRGLEQYERALRQARERAQRRQDFKAELGADFHPGAFREYERALANADRQTRQFGRSQSGLGGSLSSFNRNVLALANSFRVLRWPAIITGAGAATAALGAAAGAAAALTAALGPLAGALAAVPSGLSAFAQGMGALKLATFGVADAFKASEKASVASDDSMKKQRTSAEGVRSAKMSLAAAERTAQGAQESLTRARADATRQLEDMRRAVSRTALDEESAVLAVKEAREALREAENDPGTSFLDVDRAELAVRQAQQDLKDTRAEGQRLRQDNARAQAGGVSNMPEVVDARKALVDANRAVAESARDVRIAQRDSTEALTKGSAAAEKYATEMAKLPPAARRFVRFLTSLKDEFQRLRAVTAQGLFPGVQEGITRAMKNFPILERGLGRTAQAFGDLAAKAGALVGSRAFGRDLETQMGRNVTLIRRGGDTALNLANALRHITIAAGPLVDWMSRYALRLSETIERQTEAGRKSGAMARFFEETRLTIDRLMRITADLAGALKNIGTIAYETLGKQLLGDLTRSADKFREWTESARGKNDIREYFKAITPVVYEAARLVEDVTKAFFRVGQNETIAPMLATIRTEALPAIEELVTQVTTTLGPAMIDVIAEFAKVLANLSAEGGALAAFISGFERILELIGFITEEVPFIGTVLGTLAAAGGIYKALQVGATITGLRTIGRMIAGGGIAGALKGVGRGVAGGAAGGAAAGGGGGGFLDMFKGRGDTPAKPLYVFQVNETPGGGGPGGIAKTIGKGAFATFLTNVAIPAAPVLFAAAATYFIAKYGPNQDLPTRGKPKADRDEAGAPSSGRERQRSALSRNIEDLEPLKNVPALNDMADALDRLAGTGKGGRAPQVKALGDRMRDALREGNREKIESTADALDKLAGNKDDSTSRTLRRLADDARKLGGVGTSMKEIRTQLGLTRNAFSRMSADGKVSMNEIRQTTAENTRRIKARLGDDSEAGRKALATNFREARKAVRETMRDGVTSTKRGMRQIRELMAQELKATYGITIKGARQVAAKETVENATGGDSPSGGGPIDYQRGGRVQRFAQGGWLGGSKNLVGPDNIQITPNAIAAPGEYFAKGSDGRSAVINRHQAPVVDMMLKAQGKSLDTIPAHSSLPMIEQALGGPKGLDGLFNMIQRPHMFARGGIVPVPGFPGESANKSVIGKIVAIAKRFGLTLTDAFGAGHESPGHTVTGTAADFDGPDKNMDRAVKYLVGKGYLVGYDGRFGSKNWPDHGPSTKTPNHHFHVELGGRTGGSISAEMFRKIIAPRVKGGGVLGRIAQAGLRMTAAAANRLGEKAGEAQLTMPVPGGKAAGAGADVVAAFRRAIAATRAPAKARLALWMAGIVESGLRNLPGGDADSEGALQLRVGLHGRNLARDPYAAAVAFLRRGFTGAGGAIALSRNRGMTAGNVAQAVQGSQYPARYDAVRGQAQRYMQAGGRLLEFAGGGRSYPLGKRGKVIGTPYSGTHSLGNWQSDNALDISIPNGTPVLAVADGKVVKVRGGYSGGASRFDGFQVTQSSGIGGVFYTHLMRAGVRVGEQLDAGERIGLSGSANGVPHLHIGFERGKPQRVLGAPIGSPSGTSATGTGGTEAADTGGGPRRGSAFNRELRGIQSVLAWMASRGRGQRGGYFARGGRLTGKRDAPSVLVSGSALGIRRALKKGVGAYDNAMQSVDNLQKRYTLDERKYGMSDVPLVNDDGSLNQRAIAERVKELDALIALREQIARKLEQARSVARKVVDSLRQIIRRYSNSLKHTKNRKDRTNIKDVIANAREQLATFQGAVKDLGPDIENANMDIQEVIRERAEVLGTEAAPTQDAEDVSTSTADQTADQAAQLAQAEERARVATERAEISERSLSVLGSPAGMNPSGIGSAPQITINTLHPADPATLTAIAQASNKGNWYGGNVQSSRVVTGV